MWSRFPQTTPSIVYALVLFPAVSVLCGVCHTAPEDLSRIYSIQGQVRLAGTEEPLPYFTITLDRDRKELGRTWSDAAGNFMFDVHVPPGKVRIRSKASYPFYSARDVVIDLGERFEERAVVEAECEFSVDEVKDLRIDGWVTLWDGKTPAERVEIRFSRDEDDLRTVWSDHRGFYHFDERGLPPGDYELAFITGNDLLVSCSEEIRIAKEDIRLKLRTKLTSPWEGPLRKAGFYGRVSAGSSDRLGVSGAQIEFTTGSYVLGTIKTGGGGYFLSEKVYVPQGPVMVKVLPKGWVFRGTEKDILMPAEDGKIPTFTLDLHVALRKRAYLLIAAGLLGSFLAAWVVLVRWIRPEWRRMRAVS